ncbi:polyketide antibiotic transporter [Leucobacter iarius]|uniref:Exporter of polyketide antibiotics n=1 Tax=Leucobacter iarius TaxID=333963 RepID=A0ABN2LI01_9MICO
MPALMPLLRLRIRRDRVQLLLWIIATVLLAYSAQSGVSASYGSLAERKVLLQTVVANPVILLFRGLPSGPDDAAFMLFLILPWLAMMAAFMALFLAVRHTRGDEESGRAELIGATRAGRSAPLTATLIEGAGASVLLGLLVAVVSLALGLAPGGSLVAGAGTAVAGLVFLAVGLCAAQLMRTSRGANALGVWVLLATFLASGIGNALGTPSADLQRIESSWLAWTSPFGWIEQTRPFADDNWAPLAAALGLAVVLVGVAYALHGARDLDGGLVPERPGPAFAPASLGSVWALAWRLTRGSLLGWGIGALLTGALATGLASVVTDMGGKVPAVQQLLQALAKGGSVNQGMIVIFYLVAGVLAACFAVQTVSRARQEEAHGTAELVRSAAVDRVVWLASFVVVALVGVVVILALAVAGSALGALRAGDGSLLGDAVISGAGQAAAAAVFAAVTALVFVVLPRLTIGLGWSLVLVTLMLGLFAPLFGAPDWVVNLSPFAVAPVPEGNGADLRGLVWLLLVLVLAGGAAFALMRRRELEADG